MRAFFVMTFPAKEFGEPLFYRANARGFLVEANSPLKVISLSEGTQNSS